MDRRLVLEDFSLCPGCYDRLASGSLLDGNGDGDIPYVICYNPFCEDFNLGFPVGYGVRLLEGDRRIPPEEEDLSAYFSDPLMDYNTSAFHEHSPISEWQDIESMSFVESPVFHQHVDPSGETYTSTPETHSPYVGERSVRLEKPLSELANFSQEPILMTEAYVHRSFQVRSEEAKAKGKVLRPMNAFMLYRKAYQAHSKEFCTNAMAKSISKLVADSWRLETEELRSRFFEFAKIDSTYHHLAHPDYKYVPKQKNGL